MGAIAVDLVLQQFVSGMHSTCPKELWQASFCIMSGARTSQFNLLNCGCTRPLEDFLTLCFLYFSPWNVKGLKGVCRLVCKLGRDLTLQAHVEKVLPPTGDLLEARSG